MPASFLHKLVESARRQGRTDFVTADLQIEFVKESEQEFFKFVLAYLDEYKVLPGRDAITHAGHDFLDEEQEARLEPPAYYLDMMRQRALWKVVNERKADYDKGISEKKIDGTVEVLKKTLELVERFEKKDGCVELMEIAGKVQAEYIHTKDKGGLQGLPFPWPLMNELTGGMCGSDLITFAARPSVGKSWMLVEAMYFLWSKGYKVACLSMEMSVEAITRRFMGRVLGLNPRNIASGQLPTYGEEDFMLFKEIYAENPPLYLKSGDFGKSTSAVRSMIAKSKCDVLFIDAAYKLQPERQGKFMVRHEIMSEICADVKRQAMSNNIPIFQTWQLNREASAKAKGDGPDQKHLAGTDSVIQDSSIVLTGQIGLPPNEDTRIIKLLKNREGEGEVDFTINFKFNPPQFNDAQVINPNASQDWT